MERPLTRATEAAPTSPSAALTNPTPAALPEAAREAPIRWRAVALVVYFLGATFLLARLLVGTFHLFRIRRSCRPVTDRSDAGQVLESALVATPVTIGLFAPRVIVPLAWREWLPETLTAVLAHERAHLARRDPLVAALARLNCAVFWFHPLTWWLERKLATLAEHVCDDAAVKEVTRRSYAETLLDIAAMVRRHNGRLVWQGVGVDGDGRLGQRIDRVLAEVPTIEPTRARRLTVAASCAAAIVVVIACRQEEGKVPPLRENPELAATLRTNAARSDEYLAAEKMTAGEAAALEKALEQNPDEMATREKLLLYYRWTGKNTQPWNENVAARRRHALWLVDHHPESELVNRTQVTRDTDAEGYARLRALWLERIAGQNVDPRILSNAAWFFERSEKPRAEEILLRARAQQPDGPLPRRANATYYFTWSERLGQLYAFAITGPARPDWFRPDATSQAWGRQRLETSNDGEVLYTAASYLSNAPADQLLRRTLLERASQMDSPVALRARDLLRRLDPRESMRFSFAGMSQGSRQEALAKAAPAEKMRLLASLAEIDYMGAEYLDWAAKQKPGHPAYPKDVKDHQDKAAATFAQSKTYAREALEMADSLTSAPEYPLAILRAHIALGLHAWREGNREDAVRHLLDASHAPAATDVPSEPWSLLEYRLVNYLLKGGERQSIIEYLERSARNREPGTRNEMLREAAAVRDGVMPERYQRLLASGSL